MNWFKFRHIVIKHWNKDNIDFVVPYYPPKTFILKIFYYLPTSGFIFRW